MAEFSYKSPVVLKSRTRKKSAHIFSNLGNISFSKLLILAFLILL